MGMRLCCLGMRLPFGHQSKRLAQSYSRRGEGRGGEGRGGEEEEGACSRVLGVIYSRRVAIR